MILVSDTHWKNPISFLKQQMERGEKRFAALGDYDSPEVLLQLLNLDCDKIVLLGNHEYFLATGNFSGIDPGDLRYGPIKEAWIKNNDAREFVIKHLHEGLCKTGLKAGTKISESFNGRNIMYVHGSLEGKMEYPEVNGRLRVSDRPGNFLKMRDIGCEILIRGHDHQQSVYISPDEEPKKMEIKNGSSIVELKEKNRYVINVGSFACGKYVYFDTENMEVHLMHDGC